MEQVGKPLVSICTAVYNHEPFLRECFEGFIMQKTNFAFEVLVHDDASTDGSTNIIREYTAKYPHIFKPIYQQDNQYSKGVKVSLKYQYPRAQGKYIALCEGDDYWTDPLKLQKQVDFLEANPEYVMCTHHFNTYNQEDGSFGEDWNSNFTEDFTFDLEFFIKRDKWITQPLTLLFRRSALNQEEYRQYPNAKDVTLIYHILKKGKGIFLKDNMGIYRYHNGGIWSKANNSMRAKAEIDTAIGIYCIEKDLQAAKLIKNRIHTLGYLGMPFFKQHYKTYFNAMKILLKNFGFIPTIKLMIRSLNYFHSHFGY